MSESEPKGKSETRPMTRSYSKVVSSIKSVDSESSKSAKSVSSLKPLRPNTKPKPKVTPAKIIVPPLPANVFSSLYQNPTQSPPVFIGANASMNQTFHTSAEPSPESSEPAASFNPTPPWDDHMPS